jgi:nucleotide-binding universal stress UspA family protein
MLRFQRVTVPLSLSPADAGLLEYAAMVARLGTSREFRFVHVVTPGGAATTASADLTALLGDLVGKHFGQPADGLAVSSHVVVGSRVDQIVEFSIAHQADLILLGHRKARSGRRSLAQRLAMITPASVWLVPEGSPARIENILAPIDFSEHSADSLSLATAIARLRELESCEAIHVFFDESTIRYDDHIAELRGQEQRVFDEFMADVNTHGVTVEPAFVESSQAANAILTRAARSQSDLIVMSTRGRSRAAAILLGSVTSQVMMESPGPVLAVKHFGAHLNLFEALRSSRFWARPNPKTN